MKGSIFYSSQLFTPASTIQIAVEIHMSYYHPEIEDPFYSYLFFIQTGSFHWSPSTGAG